MDLKTYNTILAQKGKNPYEIPDGTATGDTRGHIAFRKDLVKKKVVWYNDQQADWHAFIKNYHPLYSICTAPPEHPFSRKERIAVFFADKVLAASLSIFVASVVKQMRDSEEDDYSDGDLLAVNTILSSICGLFKAISNKILIYMMVCPCCEKESCSTVCRRCWGLVGHCILCLWSCVIVLLLLIMILLAVEYQIFVSFLYSFAISNVTGWLFSLILLSCCFRIKWMKEKSTMNDQELEDKYSVTYLDYEKYKEQEGAVQTTTAVPPQGHVITATEGNSVTLQVQQPGVPQPQQLHQQQMHQQPIVNQVNQPIQVAGQQVTSQPVVYMHQPMVQQPYVPQPVHQQVQYVQQSPQNPHRAPVRVVYVQQHPQQVYAQPQQVQHVQYVQQIQQSNQATLQ